MSGASLGERLDVREPRRLLDSVAAMSAAGVLTREQAQDIVQRALKFAKADETRISVGSSYTANIRFADNRLSTSGGVTNLQVGVLSAHGPRSANVTTNDTSDAGLRRAVEQSEALARLTPENPEAMPELEPQQYQESRAWFGTTANANPDRRAQGARAALEATRAGGDDLRAAGFLIAGAGSFGVGNNKGMFAYHRGTSSNYTVTVRTTDGTGSGWAGADHPDWSRIDFAGVTRRAIEKAKLSRNPVAVEPGRYTVILEPQAVGDLVQLMAFAMGARPADEGRSAFSKQGGGNRVGEKIVDERVTILSDPYHADLLGQPFDFQGMPLRPQTWVEKGVLRQLSYDRFWAQKNGKEATGFPASVMMTGGTASLEDMIKSTPRGILVTRLWYLRQVDPRTILYTGLTRDGTFLIENGRISRSIRNLRFNESPLFLLNNVEMMGRPVRLAGTEAGGAVMMPAIKARDFNFTSLSEAV